MIQVRALLVPTDGGDSIEITKDMTLVGRKEECDLRLDHKSISKLHCVIVKTDGLLLVRDLGSTNGTRVNGQRIRRAALLPNDKLTIAHFQYRVHLGPAAEVPVQPNEHTMAMDPGDMSQVHDRLSHLEESKEEPKAAVPIQANVLPDVYPEEEKKK